MTPQLTPEIENLIYVTIKHCEGTLVKWERDSDGLRYPVDRPYTPKWINAKFRLPSGKPKCERFIENTDDEQIIATLQKKYNNLKSTFIINPNA